MIIILSEVAGQRGNHSQSTRQAGYRRGCSGQGCVLTYAGPCHTVNDVVVDNGIGTHVWQETQLLLSGIATQGTRKEGDPVNSDTWHTEHGGQDAVPNLCCFFFHNYLLLFLILPVFLDNTIGSV